MGNGPSAQLISAILGVRCLLLYSHSDVRKSPQKSALTCNATVHPQGKYILLALLGFLLFFFFWQTFHGIHSEFWGFLLGLIVAEISRRFRECCYQENVKVGRKFDDLRDILLVLRRSES